ncbi:hypothetical protein LCGC14_1369320, partial [marine sediment metagenome]
KIPEIENNLENITHFRINLPQLYRLPNFISNLSQFKQLVITSESLDNIIASFGTDEDKHRLLFRVANSCEFPRFLLQMKHLTHVWIDLPKLMKLPSDFELYFSDTKKIKFFTKPLPTGMVIIEVPKTEEVSVSTSDNKTSNPVPVEPLFKLTWSIV